MMLVIWFYNPNEMRPIIVLYEVKRGLRCIAFCLRCIEYIWMDAPSSKQLKRTTTCPFLGMIQQDGDYSSKGEP